MNVIMTAKDDDGCSHNKNNSNNENSPLHPTSAILLRIFYVILFVKDLRKMRFHFVPLFARRKVMKIKHFPCHYITNHSVLSISEPNK